MTDERIILALSGSVYLRLRPNGGLAVGATGSWRHYGRDYLDMVRYAAVVATPHPTMMKISPCRFPAVLKQKGTAQAVMFARSRVLRVPLEVMKGKYKPHVELQP
jgi:hypothetical protein